MRCPAYKYTFLASNSVSCFLADVNFSKSDLSIDNDDSACSALDITVLCSELREEALHSAAAKSD